MLFPPTIFNKRIVNSVRNFFSDFNLLLKTYKLTEQPLELVNEKIIESKVYEWQSQDFDIRVVKFFDDFAIKQINVFMKDIPSYINNTRTIRYGNSYDILINRNYPAQVGTTQITFREYHWHPRFSGHSTRACMTPSGEIDRILIDIPFFLMYEKNRVKPPGSDNGVNPESMGWYLSTGMDVVHKELLLSWMKKREHKFNKQLFNWQSTDNKARKLKILE
jgi:hypothetical protein